jgi:single-stranded DNA-specific DHH superfamily exonuclease
LEIIEQIIEEEKLVSNKIIAVRVRPPQTITKTLTGLIANQLIAKYQRPVLILNQTVHENEDTGESCEMWEGSGRGCGIDSLQSFLSDSGFVRYAEGHDNALGVGIADADFDEFIKYANETLKDFDFTPKYMVDFIYNSNNINGMDILEVASMKQLWGQGVTSSLVAVENIPITKDNIQLMKGTTLKITLPGESKVSLIKFRSSNEEYESLYSELGCVTINIVGECQINDFGGVETPQIEIKDYEIVGRAAYYF